MRATRCSVCVDSKRRPAIDKMLEQGATLTDTAARFGLVIESLRRHRKNHLGILGPQEAAKAKRASAPVVDAVVSKPGVTAPIMPVAPIRLDGPEDLVEVQRRLVRHSIATLEVAIVSGDSKLQLSANKDARENLIALGRSYGMFKDETVVNVNVDQSTQRLEVMLDQLDDARLKALLSGEAVVNLLPEEPKLVECLAIETKEQNDD